MSLIIKQFDGSQVLPEDDGALYNHFEKRSGFINGFELTHLGANKFQITTGRGIICGRSFLNNQSTEIDVQLSESETRGGLILKIDLSDDESPIEFVSYLGVHTLVQEDLNNGGEVYELLLATYTVSAVAISNINFINNDISQDIFAKITDFESLENRVDTAENNISSLNSNKANNSISKSATLSSSGWNASGELFTQRVAVSGITSTNKIIVTYAPSSYNEWNACEVRCTLQENGYLTFTANSRPTAAIVSQILVIF